MTQGKLSVANKSSGGSSGTEAPPLAPPPAPPCYEEATAAGSPCCSGSYGGDGETITGLGWDDLNIRRMFVRKVYSILMVQLLVTLAIVALFTFCDPVKDYVQSNPGWYWASYAVFFSTYLTLSCCAGPRRQFPWNLILLAVFTLSLSYVTGMLSRSVMLCLGITVLVCFSVTISSFQTKICSTLSVGRCDLMPRRPAHLLHRDARLRTRSGFCSALGICSLVACCICSFGSHRLYHVPGIRHSAADGQQALHHQPRGVHLCNPQHLPGHCLHLLLLPPALWNTAGLRPPAIALFPSCL
ncbi:protein lifeguard 2-like isoform X2 [Denticeps clupeoides]|uniref:protein lifeguard 2-like isoform X2 n=1 Tax=Denticeps clupeoides TaxID=299321 RepID=UPI0010A5102E|nr:protein lifeguard 2-like isoform X2 [Denticeps clupeoides]